MKEGNMCFAKKQKRVTQKRLANMKEKKQMQSTNQGSQDLRGYSDKKEISFG